MKAQSDHSSAIALQNVSKCYKTQTTGLRIALAPRASRSGQTDFYALDSISLEVPKGEMLGVVGMNGSGKSTLLKILAGVTLPSDGEVQVHGRVGSLLEVGAGFHPELSGYENVHLNARILGLSREETDQRMAEIVEFAGLEGYMEMPVKHYSSGMYMRLGFAVATQMDPDILLLDETMAVGDAEFQARAIQRIQEYRERGVTILMVTHDVYSARAFCENAIWLHKGKIRQRGPANEVIDAYRDYLCTLSGYEGQTILSLHGNALYPEPLASDPPIQIEKLETPNLKKHPEKIALSIAFDATRKIEKPRVRISLIDRISETIILEKDSRRLGVMLTIPQGTSTLRFSFPAASLLSNSLRFIVAIDNPEEPGALWDRKTLDFEIDHIAQPTPESFRYCAQPWQLASAKPHKT